MQLSQQEEERLNNTLDEWIYSTEGVDYEYIFDLLSGQDNKSSTCHYRCGGRARDIENTITHIEKIDKNVALKCKWRLGMLSQEEKDYIESTLGEWSPYWEEDIEDLEEIFDKLIPKYKKVAGKIFFNYEYILNEKGEVERKYVE